MLFKVFVLCMAVCAVSAALARKNLEPKPDKYKDEEGCYISKLDKVIKYNTLVPSPNSCLGYRCYPTYVRLETCAAVMASPPLKVVSDVNKLYPECCPKIVGPDEDNKL